MEHEETFENNIQKDYCILEDIQYSYDLIIMLINFMSNCKLAPDVIEKLESEIEYVKDHIVILTNRLNGKDVYVKEENNKPCSNPYPIATDEEEAVFPIEKPFDRTKEYHNAVDKAAAEFRTKMENAKRDKEESYCFLDSECDFKKQTADEKYDKVLKEESKKYEELVEAARKECYKR